MKKTMGLIVAIAATLNLSQAANAKHYNLQDRADLAVVQKSAEEGDSYFQAVFGQSLLYGIGIQQNKANGLALIKKSAELKNPLGISSLCRAYHGGYTGVERKSEANDLCKTSLLALTVLADKENDSYAQSNLGYIYNMGLGVNKDLAEALKWYKKAAEQGNSLAQNNLGVMYVSGEGVTKDLSEAVAWYGKSAEQGNPDAERNLGFMYETGQGVSEDLTEAVKWYQKAAEKYTKAIRLNPNDAKAWNDRGDTYFQLGQYQQALYDYSQVIKLNPKDAYALNSRGATYSNLKQYQKAVEDYTTLIRANPKNADSWSNRGIAYAHMKQHQKALYDYSQVIKLDPKNTSILSNRAAIYYNLKQYRKAAEDYTTLIRLNPSDADAWNDRGDAYYNLDQYQKALYDYSQAVKLNPNHEYASNNRDWTILALKSPQQVVSAFYDFLVTDQRNRPVDSGWLSTELSEKLKKVYAYDGIYLSFDPFSSGQLSLLGYKIVSNKTKGTSAWVTVIPMIGFGPPMDPPGYLGSKASTIVMSLNKINKVWKITDLTSEAISYGNIKTLIQRLDHIIAQENRR